jgi:hypothetical protein
MSSNTTRVSLYKPAGGENVNVTTDLDNNFDKIDTNLNFRVVANATARNAISPYWEGLNVRQTNDGTCWVSNGSVPISASWDQLATANTYTTAVNVAPASTGSAAVIVRTAGDGADRIRFRADGQIIFGNGTGAPDTNFYRSAADNLKTDDNFTANGTLTAGGDVNVGGNLTFTANSAEKNADLSGTTTVSNTTSESVIATYTVPANDMVVGATYKLTAWGTASVTGTPTLTWKNKAGGVAGTGNATVPATASSGVTNKVWKVEALFVCLTTGGAGTWHGNLTVQEGVSVAGANPVVAVTRMDGNSTTSIDTTASKDLVITFTWSAASASNSLICRGYTAERIA